MTEKCAFWNEYDSIAGHICYCELPALQTVQAAATTPVLLAILAGACIVPGAVMFKIITTDLSVYMGEMSAGVAYELNTHCQQLSAIHSCCSGKQHLKIGSTN